MDPELVKRAQRGDERAFEALTVSSHPRLFRLAYGILRDATLAEDATQHAFIDLWRFLKRLHEPERFEAWSYGVLVDACHDAAQRRPDASGGTDFSTAVAAAAAPDPFGIAIDRDQLSRGFRELSVHERAIIVLRYLLDLSMADTAEVLDVTEDSAASRLANALEALGAALDTEGRPGDAAFGGEGTP